MKRKKILFFINTLCFGGAERVLVDMVNNMDKAKYSITVQTLIDGGEFCNSLCPDVTYKSIIRVKNRFLKKLLIYTLSFMLPPRLVYKMFIEQEYDYECAFLEGVPTKLIASSNNKKSRKYAWIHTDIRNNPEGVKAYGSVFKQAECYKKYDKIICVSKGVKESFTNLCGNFENVLVLYNLINEEKIRELAGTEEHNNEFKIITVGRLEEPKGYDRLLRVHKKLINEGFKYKLIFVGDGSNRDSLQEFVKNNSLTDTTEFLGFCSNPYKHIQNADLLVFPSRVEGFSTVVCESIILGKPVVATDCSGTREILGDSKYGLVTENNEEAIYDGVKKLLLDEDFRMEYAANAKCRAKIFSMENRLQELEKLFE